MEAEKSLAGDSIWLKTVTSSSTVHLTPVGPDSYKPGYNQVHGYESVYSIIYLFIFSNLLAIKKTASSLRIDLQDCLSQVPTEYIPTYHTSPHTSPTPPGEILQVGTA